MVFLRHFCYVRVPFVDGTPEYSWLMDPSRYNDADKLLAHLHVKSPNYPKLLAPAFSALEEEGKLVPIASTNVENLTGTGRIYRKRQDIQVIFLEVRKQQFRCQNGPKKQKARFSAGLRGEKAPRPLRGRPQNPFLDRSLVRAKEISQAGKTLFDSVVSQ